MHGMFLSRLGWCSESPILASRTMFSTSPALRLHFVVNQRAADGYIIMMDVHDDSGLCGSKAITGMCSGLSSCSWDSACAWSVCVTFCHCVWPAVCFSSWGAQCFSWRVSISRTSIVISWSLCQPLTVQWCIWKRSVLDVRRNFLQKGQLSILPHVLIP